MSFIKFFNDSLKDTHNMNESTVAANIAPSPSVLGTARREKQKVPNGISVNESTTQEILDVLKNQNIRVKNIEPVKNGVNVHFYKDSDATISRDIIDGILFADDIVFKSTLDGSTIKYDVKYKR